MKKKMLENKKTNNPISYPYLNTRKTRILIRKVSMFIMLYIEKRVAKSYFNIN